MMELEQGTDLKVDVNNDAKIRDIAIMTSPRHHLLLFPTSFSLYFHDFSRTDPLEMMLKTKKFQWNFEAGRSWDPVWTPS